MVKWNKMWLIIFLILVIIFTGAACSKATSTPTTKKDVPLSTATSLPKPTIVPAAIPIPSWGVTPSPTPLAPDMQTGAERMVIRNGSLTLVVHDVASIIEQITQLAGTFSGYVVSSRIWLEGKRTVGTISIRVEAKYFDDALRALRGLAVDVTSESTSAKDVTEEYVDLESRLRNLQATEKQLLKFLDQSNTTEDALNVQRELTNIQGQIEQTKGRMKYLETSSATSLVDIRLEQAVLGVEFTAAKTKLDVGEEVLFNCKVSGGSPPYSYEWNFGDGKTSTDNSPAHGYKAADTYMVSLKVSDNKGSSTAETRGEYITVVSKPGWSASGAGGKAWRGFLTFGRVLLTVIMWVGIFGIVWVPVLVGVLLYRRWRKKKK